MRLLIKLSIIAASVVLLGSCRKTIENSPVTPPVEPVLPDPITATLQGTVQDENGQLTSGVTIKVGSVIATTDSRGFFRIPGAALDKHQALVTASKTGYFKTYRSFAATSGTNRVVIKLVKRTVTGTVDATAGGTATLTNGSKVTLPAGGVVNAITGAAYTGSVTVYASYIDPSASDIGTTVPGSMMANDKDGRRVMLNSYGMLAVELEGAAGQKLQVKSGSQASLVFAIPTVAQASAPPTIPLWYVDEATGLWQEQGIATKTGNTYVGSVTHFSFWNCDVPQIGVYVNFTLLNQSGQPLTGATVRLTRSSGTGWTSATYGWTDSLGHVSGMVPVNEQLALSVLTPCGTAINTQNVGPFTTAATVPPITVNVPITSTTTVTGTLQNCSGAAVTNGFAIITANNLAYYANADASGHFTMILVGCTAASGNINVTGFDNATQVQSTTTSVANTTGTINVGVLSACGVSTAQFITYAIDGGAPITVPNLTDTIYFDVYLGGSTATNYQVIAQTGNPGGAGYFYMNFFGGPGPGSYYLTGFGMTGYTPNNDLVYANVTYWPSAIGEYMLGTISGNFSSGGTPHTISGTFRLKRVN
jgi:hypothetical protein